ncbi:hypothetical protein BDR26DRAFT_1003965 [Obelidium mucronatum]|nr:hypothetical protein BDR26DRAFT_1003965 [Obelidium mucronatum]
MQIPVSLAGGIDLAPLVNNAQHADTQLALAGGAVLHAHAAVLALHSPWLRRALSLSQFTTDAESNADADAKNAARKKHRLAFPATAPATCLAVLRFLYAAKATIENDAVLDVLHFAHRLQIAPLVSFLVAHFETRLLAPKNCIDYALFIFIAKERVLSELDADAVSLDFPSALGKVAGCLLKDVFVATHSKKSFHLLKSFNGDQICDLSALCKTDPLVVWILCLSWICANHGEADHDQEEDQNAGEAIEIVRDDCSSGGNSEDTLEQSESVAEFHMKIIPRENLASAKEDLADLLFILDLHSFSLHEYSVYLEPHLSLFPSKTRSRLETHYAKEKCLSESRRVSLGGLYERSQVILSHSQSELLVRRISAIQQELQPPPNRWFESNNPATTTTTATTTLLKLIYTASHHNFSNSKFHNTCNHRGPTLTVIKLKTGDIIGGYTDKSWTSDSMFHASTAAFLFSFPIGEYDQEMRVFSVKSEGYAILGSICEAVYFGHKDLAVDGNLCCSCLSAYEDEKVGEDGEGGGTTGRRLLRSGDFVDLGVEELQVFTTLEVCGSDDSD